MVGEVTFEQLETLCGEVLPERAVLGNPLPPPPGLASSVTSACHVTNNGPYSSGGALVGEVFPLVATNQNGGATAGPSQSLTCIPATNNVF